MIYLYIYLFLVQSYQHKWAIWIISLNKINILSYLLAGKFLITNNKSILENSIIIHNFVLVIYWVFYNYGTLL